MSKKIKVAVLDSGLDTKTYFKLFNENITEGYSLCNEENSEEEKDNGFEDFNGHGTACAVKIKSLAPDVTIVPVKILLDDGRGSVEWLIQALELVKELDVQVVNMSVSSDIVKLRKTLKPLLKEISNRGIICIASKSNTRKVSIPAEMENVIGVSSFLNIFGNRYQYYKKNGIEIVASGAPELLGYENKMATFFKGNSKATAIITGIVSNYISKNEVLKSKKELIHYLKLHSKNSQELFSELDMDCANNEIQPIIANTVTRLIQEGKVNVAIENGTDLNFADSDIEDFYKIVIELERVFCCNIFKHTTVYMKYFETINNLSKMIEVSR